MKSLTFLDFSGLETRTKNIETQVQVLTEANRKYEEEIGDLRYLAHDRATEIDALKERFDDLVAKYSDLYARVPDNSPERREARARRKKFLKNLATPKERIIK